MPFRPAANVGAEIGEASMPNGTKLGLTLSLSFLVLIAACAPAADADAAAPPTPPYPDFSRPRAALCSFTAALIAGDVKVAKSVYSGQDKPVLDLIDAFGSSKANFDRFAKAATERYGRNAAGLALLYREPEVRASGKLDDAPLTSFLMLSEVREKGDDAEVILNEGTLPVAHLRKADGKWAITELRIFDLTNGASVWDILSIQALAYGRVAEEVERGKHHSAYEVYPALERAITEEADKYFHPHKRRPTTQPEAGQRP
jgi:hypothetical protein